MRVTRTIAAAGITAAAALAGAAPATNAAPAGAKLRLAKVTQPPPAMAPNDDFIVKITVRNRGLRSGKGVLKVYLAGGDATKRIGRIPTGQVIPRGFRRFTVGFKVPANTDPGDYRLRTCLKVRLTEACKSSQRIEVTSAPEPDPYRGM